ncbi:aromatic ring-hydroxylating dioxygenase subunit alpha [Streptomyces sp. NPDC020379]|uniref:aromatic ring-hydroxylating dioxygenase subunit alpha n=1 Tax=Streptomyces sp. NPDC020379 TaxID=3365071 RepID=UPI00379D8022
MKVRQFRGLRLRPGNDMSPPALPHPNGWFGVGLATEWKAGTILTKPFMDGEIVVYRTKKGVIRAVEPYCPHLGAHLGSGRIDGENIICPFHKFGFGPDGNCTVTPYGTPPRATLATLHVREQYGIIWVWHAHDRTPPTWELPALPSGEVLAQRAIDLVGHPQEVAENTVDYGHIATLHKMSTEEESAPTADGPLYSVHARLRVKTFGFGNFSKTSAFQLIGPGAVYVRAYLPWNIYVDNWTLATPIGPWRIRLWLAMGTGRTRDGKRRPAPSRRSKALSRMLGRCAVAAFWPIVTEDFPIMHHKRYVPHPRLNDKDGPVGHFRHWASQFYPPPPADEKPPPAATRVPDKADHVDARSEDRR